MNHPPVLTKEEAKSLSCTGIFDELTLHHLVNWPYSLKPNWPGQACNINMVFFWENQVFFTAIDPNIVINQQSHIQSPSIKEFLQTHKQLFRCFPLLKQLQDSPLEISSYKSITDGDRYRDRDGDGYDCVDRLIPVIFNHIAYLTTTRAIQYINLDKHQPQ
jgi:hypothetical protein